MSDLAAVKARIRALLARTPARGCTEAEAVAAAAKALELMQTYQLTEASVQCGRVEKPLGRLKRSETDRLWGTVAHAARCKAYFRIGEQMSVVYVGRLPWPDIASYLHDLAAGAAARETREYCKTADYRRRRTAKTKAKARDAFRIGFAIALAAKLRDLVDASDPAFCSDMALAEAAYAEEGPMRPMAQRATSALQQRYAGAAFAGHSAGRNTSVGWGVEGPAAPLAIGVDR